MEFNAISLGLSFDMLIYIIRYRKPEGLFARMAAKVAAFTMLQYFNLLNHRPIGQVKYALFYSNKK